MFKSFFEKIKTGLEKTKKQLIEGFNKISFGRKIDESLFEEIETVLLKADVGVSATTEIIDFLRKESKKRGITEGEQLKELLKEKLYDILKDCQSSLKLLGEKPDVILFFRCKWKWQNYHCWETCLDVKKRRKICSFSRS